MPSLKTKFIALPSTLAISVAMLTAPHCAQAQEVEVAEADEEIFVTARGRAETLQDIPESIIALDADDLEVRGIVDIIGVFNQTPNLFARRTFRAGVTFFTIRGVTTSQQGWAPITYVVDGVKTATVDAINQNALFGIERIEVLKGPQGGLYGAGAIAGAINVVTKAPTNDLEGQVIASYAKGNDAIVRGTVSGPIIEDKLLFKLSGFYRNTDGLVDSIEGDDIDFEENASIRGRLLFLPSETVSIDLRASYTDIEAGAAKQARFGGPDEVNLFVRENDPSRGIIGSENREIVDLSAKIDIETQIGTITSTTGYMDLNQDLFGTASWIAPPALGEPPEFGLFGPIFGPNALPADDPNAFTAPFDNYQDLFDNFEVFTQDLRIVSPSDQRLRWLAGFEYINRKASQGLQVGFLLGPDGGVQAPALNRFDDKTDDIWGIFGQVQYDLTDQLEITFAARYDEDSFDTAQFDGNTGALVQQLDANGTLVDALEETDSGFQPKVTVAYEVNDNVNTYFTYARGFRFGFFNTGNLTQEETTDNFEIGFRSTWLDGDLALNGSVFYIDYSDQQLTTVIAEAPFRLTTNVPSTEIIGLEMDFNYQVSEQIQVNGAVGFLDAEIEDQGQPPSVPEWTANLGLQLTQPVTDELELVGRADWRYQGSHILQSPGVTYQIDAVNLIDLRAGVQGETWRVVAFARNLANERFAQDANNLGSFVRDYNDPRSYGVEATLRF
ncbi:MAG: TonB-dependent receptor [Pseudomonadota bacterium]